MAGEEDYLRYLTGEAAPAAAPKRTAADEAAELLARGAEFANRGDFRNAIAHFDRALTLDPSNVKALNNRGYARTGLRDFPRAVADFDEALSRDPLFAAAYNNRGLVH